MRVQFATLGKSPEVVLNALRHVPMDEIHLFTDTEDSPEVITIEKFFTNEPLHIPVIICPVDKFDLMDCILAMIKQIINVRSKYHESLEISLNMTGGTKIMTSAILLVGYITDSKVFYLKQLRGEDGIGELIWVPMPRVSAKDFKGTKLRLIKSLGQATIPISLTTLKEKAGLKTLQSMSRYVKSFEENGLIKSKYVGKKRLVSLTNTGRVFVSLIEDE